MKLSGLAYRSLDKQETSPTGADPDELGRAAFFSPHRISPIPIAAANHHEFSGICLGSIREWPQENYESMQGMHQTMLAAWQAKSPVERRNALMTAMEGRLAALKDIKAPLETLYAALNDEQKKKADDLLTGMSCMM